MIFKAKIDPKRGQSAATMFELIFHTAVHNVRIGHQSPIIGLVLSMLQTIMMVAGFYVMFHFAGMRGSAIRGDYILYIFSGIFMFMLHTKAMGAVMKADAYGSGIALLVPSAIRMGVSCIGVASNEEARIARDKGFKGRLLRLRNASLKEVEGALAYRIEELVGNLEVARQLDALAARHSLKLPVHLALNSAGMSRNGLEMSTAQGKLQAVDVTRLGHLKVVGIMTHFPVEEREDVLKGLATFKQQSSWLIEHAGLDRRQRRAPDQVRREPEGGIGGQPLIREIGPGIRRAGLRRAPELRRHDLARTRDRPECHGQWRDRVDDQRLALPATDRVAVVRRVQILWIQML